MIIETDEMDLSTEFSDDLVYVSSNGLFERVVDNAFDFLDNSLEEFKNKPKYSVIDFYTAIELLLKARLMAKDWALIVKSRHGKPLDINKFEAGEYQTITLNEAYKAFDENGLALCNDECEAFRAVGRQRNRMVHFFHPVDSPDGADRLLEEIAILQMKAWYYLQKLLSESWLVEFFGFNDRIKDYSGRLLAHREYLEVKYNHVKSEFDKDDASECPVCGFRAYVGRVGDDLCISSCHVCGFTNVKLVVDCDCGQMIMFNNDGFGVCNKCNKHYTPEMLVELLNTDLDDPRDGYYSTFPAHCACCDSLNTVIRIGDNYICLSCFQLYSLADIGQCEHCGDMNAGLGDGSGFLGCTACDGRSGDLSERD